MGIHMTVFEIPLSPIPNQTFAVRLGQQETQITLTWRNQRLFADVSANGKLLVLGRLCLNQTPIIHAPYRGFVGDLLFHDRNGNDNPHFAGLGNRFKLYWIIQAA